MKLTDLSAVGLKSLIATVCPCQYPLQTSEKKPGLIISIKTGPDRYAHLTRSSRDTSRNVITHCIVNLTRARQLTSGTAASESPLTRLKA